MKQSKSFIRSKTSKIHAHEEPSHGKEDPHGRRGGGVCEDGLWPCVPYGRMATWCGHGCGYGGGDSLVERAVAGSQNKRSPLNSLKRTTTKGGPCVELGAWTMENGGSSRWFIWNTIIITSPPPQLASISSYNLLCLFLFYIGIQMPTFNTTFM